MGETVSRIKHKSFATQNVDHFEKVCKFLNSGIEVVSVSTSPLGSSSNYTVVFYRESTEEHYFYISEIRELWRDFCKTPGVDEADGDIEPFLSYLEND